MIMGTAQNKLSNFKIIVAFHSYVPCINEGLRGFLLDRLEKSVYIDHPFSFCKNNQSSISVFEKGSLIKRSLGPKIRGPEIIFYLKDILLTLYFVLRLKEKYDIFIGIDNLNAFAGLVLKKLGRVKKVVFYTIDYVPARFKNLLLNKLYHFIDKICCYNVDYIWNLSSVMTDARNKNGVPKERSAPCLVVPQGNNFDSVKRLPFEEINRFDIVFIGHLAEGKGLDFIIDAFPRICKQVPQVRLVIIGGGPLEAELKERAKRLIIDNKIIFRGFVEDNAEIDRIMASCAVALAPYEPHPDSFAYYTDPGKIKFYLAAGLPVVVTNVPPSAKEIEQARAGIAIEYDQKEFVEAVVKLLKDDKFYLECRKNAIELGSGYSWERVFTKAFEETFSIIPE